MNTITQAEAGAAAGYTAAASSDRTTEKKTSKVTNGKTIGEPELSDKAKKYYEQLKKKYGNLDFILVSRDMKDQAQANAGKYANPNRMVVLIDEDKIERMAEDEEYRKQYEGIISASANQLGQIKKSLGADASCVKTYGMKFDDGGNASFFAVIDKSLAAQRDRIEKKREQKAEERKKEKKEAYEDRIEQRRAQSAEERKKAGRADEEDTITVTASSPEELLRKINDVIFAQQSQYIRSEGERQVGQQFDFSI